MLRFYNTLSGKKEPFVPLHPDKALLYTCGPTVYDYAHIGNFRAYIFEDLLRRYLKFKGYQVTQVMNITDVDDKIIKASKAAGQDIGEYTREYIDAFFADLDALRIERAEFYPRATEHIPQMVALVKRLQEKDFAYIRENSIYFRLSAFPSYGKLSKIDLQGIKPGARIDLDEYGKEDVRDFVLWKGKREGEPFWETELGAGRPGWHIECSAMSMHYLGESFDIHTGGVDLIFPHHENEIAQSEAATGRQFVRYWLHCRHLIVEGEKMSKSKGNYYTLRDLLEEGYEPMAIRYLLLSTHYRRQLNFTREGLTQATHSLKNLGDFLLRLRQSKPIEGYNQALGKATKEAAAGMERALDDDLNISPALASVHQLVKEVNISLERGEIGEKNMSEVREVLDKFDRVTGILPPVEEESIDETIRKLIAERESARRNKEYQKADLIREKLRRMGIILEDTRDGVRWKRKP
ncbi:MAG: cysteine--tRNA ligase [Acidobacteriota bacterium]